ncbi:MAG: 30S ribosomal protein S8 [Elusimicrobia bacterium RIFCSPLOWO2_12_FULL_59_9]|nr:MAG: 30S ribosomal protein S8 [Elusimicrobia bacterium RIFCSPLOWO2_12_FULL_59_9]
MDTIGDMLTRIRNANAKFKDRVDIPYSKIKLELVRVLKDEGFIANYKSLYVDRQRGTIRVFLKYTPQKERVIQGIKRISKPGLRIYQSYKERMRVPVGFAVPILTTSKGLMTEKQARTQKVGGEVLCLVW